MSREVTLHLRPLREGDGAGPAATWSSSTFESERRAMQELEYPLEPLCGPWLARVEFTGAWGSHTPTVQAKRPPRVRAYVVRDGAVVRLPILPRTRDGLRRFGPDILRAWETADDPVAMLGWALATLRDAVWLRVKEAARVTVDDQCEAIRDAVTVDEIALSLEAQEIERRAAPFVLDARGNLVTATGEITQLAGQVIERAEREIGRAILGEASTPWGTARVQLSPREAAMVEAGVPLYYGDDGTVRALPARPMQRVSAAAVANAPEESFLAKAMRASPEAFDRLASTMREAIENNRGPELCWSSEVPTPALGGSAARGEMVRDVVERLRTADARTLDGPARPAAPATPERSAAMAEARRAFEEATRAAQFADARERGAFLAYEESASALSAEADDVLERRSRSELLADLRRFVGAINTTESSADSRDNRR